MNTQQEFTQGTPRRSIPPKKVRTSMSQKASLVFPVTQVDRSLRDGTYAKRYSKKASVYLTSALEFISGVIIKKASQEASNDGRTIISAKDVSTGIEQDVSLKTLISDAKRFKITGTNKSSSSRLE